MQNITILDPFFNTIFPKFVGESPYHFQLNIFASTSGMLGIDFGKEYAIAKVMVT